MKKICIVGFGAAGILLFLNLIKKGVPPQAIHIFDPYFDGGDLRRKWSSVRSNTTWRQIRDIFSEEEIVEPWSSLQPDQPCSLEQIIRFLLHLTQPFLHQAHLHSQSVNSVKEEGEHYRISSKGKEYTFDLLFLCTGSEPKQMDLPFLSIPLHVALEPMILKNYVSPGETIGLFGTAHSGSLIIENLTQCGAKIKAFYVGNTPFFFDRQGAYDGLKHDAADIAQKVLHGAYTNVELISTSDIGNVMRASKEIQKTVFAIGFEARNPFGFREYNGRTGRITNLASAWGFGIAYPNEAEDGKHWDVSVPAFQRHIQNQIPDILSLFGIEA